MKPMTVTSFNQSMRAIMGETWKECAKARKEHIRLYRNDNARLTREIEARENGNQRLIRIIGRLQQVCEEHGFGSEAGNIILEESLRP